MKPNCYTQFNIHLVFVVAKREYCLLSSFDTELYKYLSGILDNKGHYSLAINGYLDHVHLFFELNPKDGISDLVRELKTNTSKWINEHRFLPGYFSWQSGYGGFSYSKSQRDSVINYIMKQKQHHGRKTFRQEYLEMLRRFGIEFKDEYLFEFFD